MKRAFTLIELLVVIAIIGILSGMIFSAFGCGRVQYKKEYLKYKEKSKTTLDFNEWYELYKK